MKTDWHFGQHALLNHIATLPRDARFHYPLRHGSMKIGIYQPFGVDDQSPHDQDELYIVISGQGSFLKGDARVAFKPGDVFFVEAGVDHRFIDYSDDFRTWVIFWGPRGGER